MGNYQDNLTAEVASWLLSDPRARAEKFRRERIRHHKLVRDLLLDQLGTHDMDILEVGGGPMPVSDILPFRTRIVVDPLADEYRKVVPCPDHYAIQAEHMPYSEDFDLVICTNALDHVERPEDVVDLISQALRPGGYFAVMCAENNALTNPHPAHEHNLTADLIHRWLDETFETVWELTFRQHGYRYGWVSFEGRRGQPAFALVLRKCSGYTPLDAVRTCANCGRSIEGHRRQAIYCDGPCRAAASRARATDA